MDFALFCCMLVWVVALMKGDGSMMTISWVLGAITAGIKNRFDQLEKQDS